VDCLELIDLARHTIVVTGSLSLPNQPTPLQVYDRIIVGGFF
jgi:hypothetical protein